MEANPGKFKLPAGDLQERKAFVERMREAVQVKRVCHGGDCGEVVVSLFRCCPHP